MRRLRPLDQPGPLLQLARVPHLRHDAACFLLGDALDQRSVHVHERRGAHVREAVHEDLPVGVRLHDVEEHLHVAQQRALPVHGDVHVGEPGLGHEKALLPVPALVRDREVHDHVVPLLREERDLVVTDLAGRREAIRDVRVVADGLERSGCVLGVDRGHGEGRGRG